MIVKEFFLLSGQVTFLDHSGMIMRLSTDNFRELGG